MRNEEFIDREFIGRKTLEDVNYFYKQWLEFDIKTRRLLEPYFTPESVYEWIVLDGRDMRFVRDLSCEYIGDLAVRYYENKKEFYEHVTKEYEKKYGVSMLESKDTTWHHLGDSNVSRRGVKGNDGKTYFPKIYIKVSCERFVEEDGMEKYFGMLGEVAELLLNEGWLCELKMPINFARYVIRKDGCILYFENVPDDVARFSESLNKIYEIVRNTFGKDVRFVLGYDTKNNSYFDLLAHSIVKLIRAKNYKTIDEAVRDAVLQVERKVGSAYGHLARDFGPFTNI